MVTSAFQYVVQKMNYKRDSERVEKIIQDAKAAAWGPKMIPVEGQRKVRHFSRFICPSPNIS